MSILRPGNKQLLRRLSHNRPKSPHYIDSFRKKNIPIAVSCQLIYDTEKEDPHCYKDWTFTHLVIVDKGAFGPDARVIRSYSGDGETCRQELHATATAVAAASSIVSASGSELKKNISSYYSSLLQVPPNGKRRGVIA